MKGVLTFVDMRMLRRGDNVPNIRSLPVKIAMILTAFRVLNLGFSHAHWRSLSLSPLLSIDMSTEFKTPLMRKYSVVF